jgi:hypothetical protein
MLRIQKEHEAPAFTTFSLYGRIEPEHLSELRALLQGERQQIILDLKEVTLICRDAVRFLGLCESRGVELRNSPAYIREWILSERYYGGDVRSPEEE